MKLLVFDQIRLHAFLPGWPETPADLAVLDPNGTYPWRQIRYVALAVIPQTSIWQCASINVSRWLILSHHDDVIKWKHFPRSWPFVWGIYRSPVNSPHKGQWRGALRFSLICAWIHGWLTYREAGDLRHHRAHYDATVMVTSIFTNFATCHASDPGSLPGLASGR